MWHLRAVAPLQAVLSGSAAIAVESWRCSVLDVNPGRETGRELLAKSADASQGGCPGTEQIRLAFAPHDVVVAG